MSVPSGSDSATEQLESQAAPPPEEGNHAAFVNAHTARVGGSSNAPRYPTIR